MHNLYVNKSCTWNCVMVSFNVLIHRRFELSRLRNVLVH